MREATGTMNFTCGTCDTEFDTREAREAHQDNTGHGARRMAERTGMATRPVQRREVAFENRPAAGSAASNQFGTFAVHYATDKQTAFIASLLDRKDLTNFAGDADALREQVVAHTVNKKAASAIIDALLELPERTAATTQSNVRHATEGQRNFLRTLLAERAGNPAAEAIRDALNTMKERGELSTKFASDAIDCLLQIEVKPVELEAGVYTDGTDTYRVYLGQQSGNMLAAKVHEHDGEAEFVYAGLATKYVTAAFRKLTIEEAARFGKATGTCIICARRLDVPESVDRGIGPVCYDRMLGN